MSRNEITSLRGTDVNDFLYDGHLLFINCVNEPRIVTEFSYEDFRQHMALLYSEASELRDT